MFKRTFTVLVIAAALVAGGCGDDDGSAGSAGSAGMAGTGGAAGSAGTGGTGGSSGTGGTGGTAGTSATPMNIVETAIAAGNFTQLAAAVTAAGLADDLQGDGPFTVFAPSDAAFDAFEAANPGVLDGLTTEQLIGILTYHVVPGTVMSTDLADGQLAETLAGSVLAVSIDGSTVKVNEATVVTADIEASNGVIHVIDTIILPPGDIIEVATAAGSFTSLASALTSAGLVDDLQGEGPFTVFAPTDAAFAALSAVPSGQALIDVLLYHVISGVVGPLDLKDGGVATTLGGSPVLFDLSSGAMINDANITVTNVVASNGVIHVIDAVIVPPTDDIVATAVANGSFTSLAGALTDAGLVDDLQGDGPFTVFAPTDDAFAALSAVPSGQALIDVLLYHVVSGAVGSGDLVAGTVPTLLDGESLTVALASGVQINDANVTIANILTKNGVIHVIDAVLVP